MFSKLIFVVVPEVYTFLTHLTMNLRLVNFIIYVNCILQSIIDQKFGGGSIIDQNVGWE